MFIYIFLQPAIQITVFNELFEFAIRVRVDLLQLRSAMAFCDSRENVHKHILGSVLAYIVNVLEI